MRILPSARSQSFNRARDLGLPGNKRATLTPMIIFAKLKLAVSRNQIASRNIRFKYPIVSIPSRKVGLTSDSLRLSDARIALERAVV